MLFTLTGRYRPCNIQVFLKVTKHHCLCLLLKDNQRISSKHASTEPRPHSKHCLLSWLHWSSWCSRLLLIKVCSSRSDGGITSRISKQAKDWYPVDNSMPFTNNYRNVWRCQVQVGDASLSKSLQLDFSFESEGLGTSLGYGNGRKRKRMSDKGRKGSQRQKRG